jgi:hypothetical protein
VRVAPRRAAVRALRRRAALCVYGARCAFPAALARGARRCKCTCDPRHQLQTPHRGAPSAERVAVPCGDIEWASAPCAAGG